jgi:hypothetical protein
MTRRFQFKIDHFPPSSTDPVRKVLFEQSPSSALGAMADACAADGGGGRGGGWCNAITARGEASMKRWGAWPVGRRGRGGGAERVHFLPGG